MASDRYEGRRGWREPRSRFSQEQDDRFEHRGRGWDRDDDERGPHILNRSFSGTYER